MRVNGGVEGATIPAGGSATIFADVAYSARRRAPVRVLADEGEGRITDPATLPTGKPVAINAAAFAGTRRDEMPLNDQVVGFPE